MEVFPFLLSILGINIISDSGVHLVMDKLIQLLTLQPGNNHTSRPGGNLQSPHGSRPFAYVLSALKCFSCPATWHLKPEGTLVGFTSCFSLSCGYLYIYSIQLLNWRL